MAEGKPPVWIRAARVYREKGGGGVWFGVLSKAGYRRLVLLEASLAELAPTIRPRVEAEIRRLGPGEGAAFAALGQGDEGVFAERAALGHECWGAWVSGRLRHVAWCGFGRAWVEYLRCRVELDEGVAYTYRAYTEPASRGLALGSATQSVCLADLRGRGQRAAVVGVLPDNPWAFTPWLRTGFRRVGVVRSLGPGARPLVWVRYDGGVSPARGWRFERARTGEDPGARGPSPR